MKNLLFGFATILFLTSTVSAQQPPPTQSRPGPLCEGRPLTIDKARSWYRPGQGSESREFGKDEFVAFTKVCNKFSGCAPWSQQKPFSNKTDRTVTFEHFNLYINGTSFNTHLVIELDEQVREMNYPQSRIVCYPVGAPNFFSTTQVSCKTVVLAEYNSPQKDGSFVPVFSGTMTNNCLSLTARDYQDGSFQVEHIINLSAQY